MIDDDKVGQYRGYHANKKFLVEVEIPPRTQLDLLVRRVAGKHGEHEVQLLVRLPPDE